MRCEADDCVGDLIRLADTLERNTCHKAGLSFGAVSEAVEHSRFRSILVRLR
jgi:hypothetical protein